MKDHLIIANHIGTSLLRTVETELMPLIKDIKTLSPKADVELAFSSDRARRKLSTKGLSVRSIQNVLEWGVASGYENITIMPLHVVGGSDYRHLTAVVEVLDLNIRLLPPLLTNEMDCHRLSQAILETLAVGDVGKSLLLVGHGTTDTSNDTYGLLEKSFTALGHKAKVVTLESEVNEMIEAFDDKALVLFPLFTVSGYHVQKDVFDGDESIEAKLKAKGFKVTSYNQGLLAFDPIRQLYLDRL